MQHVYNPVFGPIPLWSILPQAKLSSFGIGFSTHSWSEWKFKGTGHGTYVNIAVKKEKEEKKKGKKIE